jgi:Tfp pilus assembly protein PilN
MELETLERRLNEPRDGQTAAAFLERQEYRKQIARTRPDLIDLMTVLQETRPEGVLLDSLVFELGKPVEIKGQADSYEQAYEFHKNLSGKSGVSKPQLIEPAMDEKTRKVKFAIQFAYRHFSR